jgi:hypothetical protein
LRLGLGGSLGGNSNGKNNADGRDGEDIAHGGMKAGRLAKRKA